jgi:hypothetical protein
MPCRIPVHSKRNHSISQSINIKIREIKPMKSYLITAQWKVLKLVTNSSSHFFRLVYKHTWQNCSLCITLNTQTHVPSQLKSQLNSTSLRQFTNSPATPQVRLVSGTPRSSDGSTATYWIIMKQVDVTRGTRASSEITLSRMVCKQVGKNDQFRKKMWHFSD